VYKLGNKAAWNDFNFIKFMSILAWSLAVGKPTPPEAAPPAGGTTPPEGNIAPRGPNCWAANILSRRSLAACPAPPEAGGGSPGGVNGELGGLPGGVKGGAKGVGGTGTPNPTSPLGSILSSTIGVVTTSNILES